MGEQKQLGELICAAQSGDVRAAVKLIGMFRNALLGCLVCSPFPLSATPTIRVLHGEARDAENFLRGFIEGGEWQKAKRSKRRRKKSRGQ